ncbi:MAG: hypothetical protein CMJ67_08990 [Planctomycetaceae bacterium]|nr:hypothetical protein [Planctomycetaceae bacterium]
MPWMTAALSKETLQVPCWSGSSVLAGLWLVLSTISGAARAEESEYVDAGRGDVRVVLPSDRDPEEPLPLILLLHSFAYSGEFQETYFRFADQVDEQRFILCLPDGNRNLTGQRFWNATPACCDVFNQNPDDSTYLVNLVDLLQDTYAIDADRLHIVGHSNGGFMAHRMVCEHDGMFAGIATLAAATFEDPNACVLETPVHVLQVHGTLDVVIRYGGGCLPNGCYPSAEETQALVAEDNQCGRRPDPTPDSIDIVPALSGAETEITVFENSCAEGGSAELWTVQGGGHNPPFDGAFARETARWLLERSASGLTGDLNDDGRVDSADLGLLLAAWGRCEGCDADFDGDGMVGGSDLGQITANWSP